MIKLKDLLKEAGTGAGAGAGSTPDFITAGKMKNSKTEPSGLDVMKKDSLKESIFSNAMAYRNEMLKYIPKKIDQWTFLGKTEEGDWELSHPQHPTISMFATPFIQGSVIMKVKVDKNEDEIDSWNVPFTPTFLKTKKPDPKADAENYIKIMKEQFNKIHFDELEYYED